MVDRNTALGASGVLAHVICAASGTLYTDSTRRLAFELAQERFSPWHHSTDLALGAERGLHTHHVIPVEAVPGLVEHISSQRAAGVKFRQMILKGETLRNALPDADEAIEYIRIAYDLPGLVEYVRCQPRIELAKRSDSHRIVTHAELLAAAEFWCSSSPEPGRKRRAVMTWTAGPALPEVIAERRERRAAAAAEVERLDVERLDVERRAAWRQLRDLARLNRKHFPELAVPVRNGTVAAPRRLAAPRVHTPRCWPAADRLSAARPRPPDRIRQRRAGLLLPVRAASVHPPR